MATTDSKKNRHENAEHWLKDGASRVAPLFEEIGLKLPENIRWGFAFTSQGKGGKSAGEWWDPSASEDGSHFVIVRCDQTDPVSILGTVVHKGLKATLRTAKHGKEFRDNALRLGLEGAMRSATPGPSLRRKLEAIAAQLGPFPHPKLDWTSQANDKPRKQTTRMLKAECLHSGCGYTARLAARWVKDVGPPHCPKHGAMFVPLQEEEEGDPVITDQIAAE